MIYQIYIHTYKGSFKNYVILFSYTFDPPSPPCSSSMGVVFSSPTPKTDYFSCDKCEFVANNRNELVKHTNAKIDKSQSQKCTMAELQKYKKQTIAKETNRKTAKSQNYKSCWVRSFPYQLQSYTNLKLGQVEIRLGCNKNTLNI